MTPSLTTAVIYARISQDRSGEAQGIERQVSACKALAQAKGFTVVEVFTDNDISASTGKVRPGFEKLLRHDADVIICWALDRLLRRNADAERVRQDGRPVHFIKDGQIDLTTSAGRMMLVLLTAFAEEETAQKQARLRAQRSQAAAAGRQHFFRASFGYNADGTVNKVQAKAIQTVVHNVLAKGQTFASQARWLNDNGITTVNNKEWTLNTLKQMLTRAHLSGQREHNGVITAKGQWEAILTPEQTAEIRALYHSRSRPRSNPRHLLSGFPRCGICGNTLIFRPDQGGRWACIKVLGTTRCGGLSLSDRYLSPAVDEEILKLLRDSTALTIDEVARRKNIPTLAELDERRGVIARQFSLGRLQEADFEAALVELEGQHQQALSALSVHPWGAFIRFKINILELGLDAGVAWADANIETRRSLIAAAVESIVVKPAARRGAKFTPDRISITLKPRIPVEEESLTTPLEILRNAPLDHVLGDAENGEAEVGLSEKMRESLSKVDGLENNLPLLGDRLIESPAVRAWVGEDNFLRNARQKWVIESVSFHALAKWESTDLDTRERLAASQAHRDGVRVITSHQWGGDDATQTRIWVITEAEDAQGVRPFTLVLLPEEF
jgi:DNA invertase Pin-like site-specific DNA recombinase